MAVTIDLSGRVAVITGASRKIGIGAEIARLFAKAGADLLLTVYPSYDSIMTWGSRAEDTGELLEELRGCGVRVELLEADLGDPAVPDRIITHASQTLGGVDILVNNATHDIEEDIYSLSAASLDRHYAVNVRGPVLLCAAFARQHTGKPGGRIINMVSGELFGPMPGNLPYVITKGAIDALTISLSMELAPKHITVNAIDPGITDTGWIPPEQHQHWTETAPFGRVGLPRDTAHLALFLASDLGGWITGQILHSRGGL